MPDKRRTAREVTPADLDRAAEITPRDQEAADLHARRFGSPLLNAMLDATPDEEPGG
jgi:hypothetical protein